MLIIFHLKNEIFKATATKEKKIKKKKKKKSKTPKQNFRLPIQMGVTFI